ncbi:MAG: hypothetical protein CSA81_13565 [Acidobacteria bacterium]|nr:MAG: hypothetical protein CSA81_13565 [Acidobacteriota bacterium]
MTHNNDNNSSADFAYADMVRTFMKAGVQPPPVPKCLRQKMYRQEEWCWTTMDVNPFSMYEVDLNYMLELQSPRLDEYLAVSHAGHGINSYGLQLALVYGPLVIFVQNAFGGAYHGSNAIKSIKETYSYITNILELLPEDVQSQFYSERLVVLWSGFRELSCYSVQDVSLVTRRLYSICGLGCEDDSVSSGMAGVSEWRQRTSQEQLFTEAGKVLQKILNQTPPEPMRNPGWII